MDWGLYSAYTESIKRKTSEDIFLLVLRLICCHINILNLKSKLIMTILHYGRTLAGCVGIDITV